MFSCKKDVEKILPSKIDITESLYSSVTIQPDSLYQVFAAVNGILDKNLVAEGDLVKKGDPLLQIINNSPKISKTPISHCSSHEVIMKGMLRSFAAFRTKLMPQNSNLPTIPSIISETKNRVKGRICGQKTRVCAFFKFIETFKTQIQKKNELES